MSQYEWSQLTKLQIGKYAEYFVKMEFTLRGVDVYSAEVDEKGIDFVVRTGEGRYFDVQVKSVRGMKYIYFLKDRFKLRSNLLAAIVIFNQGEQPSHYLIPATAWLDLNKLLRGRDYVGRKSKPEWGLNLSRRNLDLLETYEFGKMATALLTDETPRRAGSS